MSTRAAHDWAKPHNGSRHGTIRHGLRLLVSLLLPLGLIGLAETAVLAAANTSTGSVNAGPPAGALAPSVRAGLFQTCEATTDSTLACGGLNGSAQPSPRSAGDHATARPWAPRTG